MTGIRQKEKPKMAKDGGALLTVLHCKQTGYVATILTLCLSTQYIVRLNNTMRQKNNK